MYEIFANRNKFDFEIGYFIKSPCRDCHQREELPRCCESCPVLDRVQAVLAEGISCFNHYAAV